MTVTNTAGSTLNPLLTGLTWAPAAGTAVDVTYSFMTSAPSTGEAVGFQPISLSDQAVISQALQTFSAVAKITFSLVPNGGNADIMFGLDNQTDSDGLTYEFPGAKIGHTGLTSFFAAHVYFRNSTTQDDVNTWLVLHELGNATGLKDFSGLSLSQDAAMGLPASEANFDYTVMANNFPPHGSPQGLPFTSTPALLDIQALQYLYGANQAGFTAGATSTPAGLVYAFMTNDTPECIWVGSAVGGKTTFDFSTCSGDVVINLNAGSFSSTGITPSGQSDPFVPFPVGDTPYNNISIAYGTVIQNAVGNNADDVFYGNNAGDTLTGGTGTDTFYIGGGNTKVITNGGTDTLVFPDPMADYTINNPVSGTTVVIETGGGTTTIVGSAALQFQASNAISIATVQDDYAAITRTTLSFDQATTEVNAIDTGTTTEAQYVNGLLSQVADTTTPVVAVEGSMYGAVGSSAEIIKLVTQFLPAQVAYAIQIGLDPQVFACLEVGLAFAFANENGSSAFANNFGPSIAAMPATPAGDAAFAAAATNAIFGSAQTANTAPAILGYVHFLEGFFTVNGIVGVQNPTADQIVIAARAGAWGEGVAIALENNLGSFPGQTINFLEDAAQGTAIYSASLSSQPIAAPFQGAATASASSTAVQVTGIAAPVDHIAM